MQHQDQSPATKADLRGFAVKADLERFATKDDLVALRDEFLTAVREMIRPLAIEIVHIKADVADIRGHVKEKMVTRDEFHSRMDSFSGRVADFDYSSAKNRSRLDDHESRIKSLEEKRA